MSKPVVLITGVSGYLGSQVALKFLKEDKFTVWGTVRSVQNPKKIEPLKQAFGDLFAQLTLKEADLENKESIMKACEGAEFIVHTASPFPIEGVKDEMVLIKPAVDGTLAVMEACLQHKIKRVVITSSVAAVICPMPADRPKDGLFDEKCWSHEKSPMIDPYYKSKTLAEKAAWDF